MDGKNKLTETYMPDKAARKERVIVGLSGGIDSLVAAYLLKIQRYELIAVTVVVSWEELGKESSEFLSCALPDKKLKMIEAFCHQLGIPHHFVRTSTEFKETVLERWVATKISGEFPNQCLSCHDLRMETLHAKMKQLGAKGLVTGHFAKIFRNEAGNSFVQSSNDEQQDQSAILSRLPQEILKDIILPLADLQKKEVLKLAENFGLIEEAKNVQMFDCFPENEVTLKYLSTMIPERFRREGEIVNLDLDRLGDHDGFYHFRRGNKVSIHDKQFIFARVIPAERKIILAPPSWLERNRFYLRNCSIPPETSWESPFKGVVMKDGEAHDAWIYPKTLSACVVELESPISLIEGETLCVQKKKGRNARILLTGVVQFSDGEKIESDKDVQVDYGRDF